MDGVRTSLCDQSLTHTHTQQNKKQQKQKQNKKNLAHWGQFLTTSSQYLGFGVCNMCDKIVFLHIYDNGRFCKFSIARDMCFAAHIASSGSKIPHTSAWGCYLTSNSHYFHSNSKTHVKHNQFWVLTNPIVVIAL
jgi:hypothetical protein